MCSSQPRRTPSASFSSRQIHDVTTPSANYETIRTAFADAGPESDLSAEAVRLVGIEIFERSLDKALAEERRQQVSGKLG